MEDNFTDIIGKAQRGCELSDSDLAARAGVSREDVVRVKGGAVLEAVIRKIAPVLNLHPAALLDSAKESWHPKDVHLDGLAQITTRYYDMTVNAFLVWDHAGRGAVAFDTGADAEPLLKFLTKEKLVLKLILLTHSHADHVGAMGYLRQETGAPAYICEAEPVRGADTFSEGKTYSVGHLEISTRHTWGHSPGGTTYVVAGLAVPIAVVGDALFAGSMGGGMVSYADALANNRKKILTLPDDTIICPGHGPMTTVKEEKEHNPFFPEFKIRQG